MRLLLLPLALCISAPAWAAPLDGDWTCMAGREAVGALAIDGVRYTLESTAGTLAPEAGGPALTVVDGPLPERWHVSRLLPETADGAAGLRLQVTAMYAPRSIGSCSRLP